MWRRARRGRAWTDLEDKSALRQLRQPSFGLHGSVLRGKGVLSRNQMSSDGSAESMAKILKLFQITVDDINASGGTFATYCDLSA